MEELFKDIVVCKQEGMEWDKEGLDFQKNVVKPVQFKCGNNG